MTSPDNELQCNNCDSTFVSAPFQVNINDRQNDYHETRILVKCFHCGFIGDIDEFKPRS